MVLWMRGAFTGAVDWLRAGYPDVAPPPGYCSLVALYGPRSITKHQVAQVFHHLSASTTAPTATDIKTAIVKVTDRLPNPIRSRKYAAASGHRNYLGRPDGG